MSTINIPAGSISLDISLLQNLRDNVKGADKMWTKVGIIGKHNARDNYNGADIDNPTLGLIHEKGSVKAHIPQRSFLLMPLMMKLPNRLKQIGSAMFSNITTGAKLEKAFKQLGVESENIVQQAFETGGFGQWAPWSKTLLPSAFFNKKGRNNIKESRVEYSRGREIEYRQSKRKMRAIGPQQLAILVRSGQLRKSISSKVMGGS